MGAQVPARGMLLGRRSSRVEAGRALAAFFGNGGVLSLLVALLHPGAEVVVPALVAVGVLSLSVAAGLILLPTTATVRSAVLAVGSVLIALVVASAGRADIALAFAGLVVWVMVYAAVYLPPPATVAHTALTLGLTLASWSLSGRPWVELTLVLVTALTTAAVVGRLVHVVRGAADRDAPTGLLTGAALARRGAPRFAAARTAGEPMAVLMVQAQGLHDIVRSLGHGAAEQVVLDFVAALSEHLLPAAVSADILAARPAGDRIALLLGPRALRACRDAHQGSQDEDVPTPDAVPWAAARALHLVRGPHRVAGVPLHLDGHVGVAVSTCVDGELPDLLRAAEQALGTAVADAVPVHVYEKADDDMDGEQLRLLAELRDGIVAGQLRVYYQVQVSAHSGRPTAVEALVRWQHPTRGLLPPGLFLPAAEGSDVIADLTWVVLDDALRQCATWIAAGLRVPVSVNLSAKMLTHEDLAGQVAILLDGRGVPPELLTLEVTETAIVAQPRRAAETLAALRTGGVRISLDDFGTGQTSLTLLAQVRFDEIKVDRSFVAAALTDPTSAAIVRSVIDLGRSLGQTVVAEGVEDEATATWLAELGCHELQGYLYGRPVPPEQLTDLPRDPALLVGRLAERRQTITRSRPAPFAR